MSLAFKLQYKIDSDIAELGIKSVVIAELHGITCSAENSTLEELKEQAVMSLLKQGTDFFQANEILASYRQLVTSVGRSAKKFPPSAESLIDVVIARQRLPKINTIVDSYNIVASKTYLALGVHDIDKLQGPITFRRSTGGESFVSVGGQNVKTVQAGDYIYSDESQVLAWLDSKDSDAVKVTDETKNIVIIIQGTPATSGAYRIEAVTEACQLIQQFCGGQFAIQEIFA